MAPEVIVAGVVIAFLAATCQSVTGFGFALTMTPLLALAWDVKPTIATSILLGLLILFPLLAEVRGSVSVGRVSGMLLGFLFGAIPGIILVERLDEDALRVMVAATVILASVSLYFSPRIASGEDSIPMRLVAGALSGAIGTSTSLGGPPIVLYLLGRERDMPSFRATIMAFFLPAGAVTLLAFILVGQVTRDVLVMSAAALPGIAAGILFGAWLRRRLDPERFRAIVLAILVATSVAALAGSAARL